MKCKVAIIMGSDSDLPVMRAAAEVLTDFGVKHEVKIVSAHRSPDFMLDFAHEAQASGFDVIIAGAGGAAHLPGMVASATTLPVIGVPIQVGKLNGLDALLSIAQMPRGVPVATMAVDNATNAALMAIRMLALKDGKLDKKLKKYAKGQQDKVRKANHSLKQALKEPVQPRSSKSDSPKSAAASQTGSKASKTTASKAVSKPPKATTRKTTTATTRKSR